VRALRLVQLCSSLLRQRTRASRLLLLQSHFGQGQLRLRNGPRVLRFLVQLQRLYAAFLSHSLSITSNLLDTQEHLQTLLFHGDTSQFSVHPRVYPGLGGIRTEPAASTMEVFQASGQKRRATYSRIWCFQ